MFVSTIIGTSTDSAAIKAVRGLSDSHVVTDISPIRIISAFVFCCLVALAAVAVLRVRHGRPFKLPFGAMKSFGLTGVQRVEVIESRRLSVHADIALVRCDDREFIVACGPGVIKLLHQERVGNIGESIGCDSPSDMP